MQGSVRQGKGSMFSLIVWPIATGFSMKRYPENQPKAGLFPIEKVLAVSFLTTPALRESRPSD
jgi:hypothetical protein